MQADATAWRAESTRERDEWKSEHMRLSARAHANAEDVFALVSQKLPTLTKRARVTDNKNKPDQCGFRAISFSISASVCAR